MHPLSRFASIAGIALLTACTSALQPSSREAAKPANQKDQVVALLKSIETGDPAPAAVVNPNKYIQHNLSVGDGVAGLGAALAVN